MELKLDKQVNGSDYLNLDAPIVMGILNVTPDSFSDGGQYQELDRALQQAKAMVEHGARIIDVGGESTRPGAAEVSLEDELARVIPIIEKIAAELDVAISIDTSKPEVMRQAIAAGAHIINDIRALQEEGALAVAAELGVPVCLMHMQGQPRTMQSNPVYDDVTGDVIGFFRQRIDACLHAGIARDNLILDPGFGFGKTLAHNYQLLAEIEQLHEFNLPLLVGVSRKSMIGNLLDRKPNERLAGSLACATFAASKGAQILRVHDVQETADALAVVAQINQNY